MTGPLRAIVLRQGLVRDQLPQPLHGVVIRRYPYLLDGVQQMEVVELAVTRERALTVAMELALALRPYGFYAHLVGAEDMYVAFPRCTVQVRRGDEQTAAAAQRIGEGFGIPLRQMRFTEMFDQDHPDSAQRALNGGGRLS